MISALSVALALFVLVLGGAGLLYGKLAPQLETEQLGSDQPETPEEHPDFTVYDKTGAPVKLSEFFGKPIVLNFWASWCGPCASEMPDFEAAYQALGQDIHFVMVNQTGGRETMETAQEFLAQSGYTFPVCFDTELSASMAYGVSAIPMTFFIDAEGYPVAYAAGALSAEHLQRGIDMILPE